MAPKITWTKTSNRQGEFGATYESSNGWSIEVILEESYVTGSSRAKKYAVSHYEVFGPCHEQWSFDTLADAKAVATVWNCSTTWVEKARTFNSKDAKRAARLQQMETGVPSMVVPGPKTGSLIVGYSLDGYTHWIA